MDAREYLETVRAAQRGIDRRLAVIQSMQAREQVRAQRYDAVGKGAHGTDFMRSTDDRIDYERRSGAELSELRHEGSVGASSARACDPPTRAGAGATCWSCATARTAPCRRSRGHWGCR